MVEREDMQKRVLFVILIIKNKIKVFLKWIK